MNNYKTLKIDKSMYNADKSFSAVLEKIDPSEQYAGTELEGSDAFQRQLKRFDIKVSGPNSDKVEKFFQTSDSAVLFPEYVSRAVRQGMVKVASVVKRTASGEVASLSLCQTVAKSAHVNGSKPVGKLRNG